MEGTRWDFSVADATISFKALIVEYVCKSVLAREIASYSIRSMHSYVAAKILSAEIESTGSRDMKQHRGDTTIMKHFGS